MRSSARNAWLVHPGGFNVGVLAYTLGGIVGIIGLSMLAIGLAALAFGGDGWGTFIAVGLAAGIPGIALAASVRPPDQPVVVRARDIFLVVSLGWTVAALLSAVPIWIAGDARSFTAAVFEAMSGYTTTGATIFDEVEALPRSVLVWRSATQWLGGIGIIVLLVGIAPALGVGTIRALFAELAGPTKERYTPRIADTARALVRIYVALTVACFASYLATGIGWFDSLNHAMTTISTGGYSTHTDSFGFFDQASTRIVAIVFMVLGGVNFGMLILLAMRRRPSLVQQYEFVAYLVTLAVVSILVTTSLVTSGDASGSGALLDATFNVVSVITTTGFITADFDAWNEVARVTLLMAMFIGGSAGSTVGAIKIIRWMILVVTIRGEVRRLLHPTAVISIRIGDRRFSDRDLLTLLAFLAAYMTVFGVAAIGVAAVSDLDAISAVSASAATINLVGPGLGAVGAIETYSVVSDPGLALLTANMLLGRLEVFTVLVLFVPAFWRRR